MNPPDAADAPDASDQPTSPIDRVVSALSNCSSIGVIDGASFADGYDDWDTLESPDYHNRFLSSLGCFSAYSVDDFPSLLDALPPSFTNADFCAAIALAPQSPHPARLLFLVDHLLATHKPSLTFDGTMISHQSIEKVGPIVRWLIGRVIKNQYCPVSVDSLISLFTAELMDENESFTAISVAAAHLITMAAAHRNRLSVENYCTLIQLSQRQETTRDICAGKVIAPFMKSALPADMELFPRELLRRFPDAPVFVRSFFKQGAVHSEEFLKGWIAVHEEMHESSMNYLSQISKFLPVTILAQFPATDSREAIKAKFYERVERRDANQKWSMTNVGVVFLVLALVLGLLLRR
jgi:hypothetical protein